MVVVVVGLTFGRGRCGRPHLLLGFFAPLPLHPAILEPNFHLRLGEHERRRHFEPFGPRQVFILPELILQLEELLARKGRPRSAGLAQESGRSGGCGAACRPKKKEKKGNRYALRMCLRVAASLDPLN